MKFYFLSLLFCLSHSAYAQQTVPAVGADGRCTKEVVADANALRDKSRRGAEELIKLLIRNLTQPEHHAFTKAEAIANVESMSTAYKAFVEKYGQFTCKFTDKQMAEEESLNSESFATAARKLDKTLKDFE